MTYFVYVHDVPFKMITSNISKIIEDTKKHFRGKLHGLKGNITVKIIFEKINFS